MADGAKQEIVETPVRWVIGSTTRLGGTQCFITGEPVPGDQYALSGSVASKAEGERLVTIFGNDDKKKSKYATLTGDGDVELDSDFTVIVSTLPEHNRALNILYQHVTDKGYRVTSALLAEVKTAYEARRSAPAPQRPGETPDSTEPAAAAAAQTPTP